ncbi:MAG TPA: nucleotidyltransferase family protein [Candidatus Binatia bacterium]|nr:nucleotidyltransferase family protein [Candidatus Binatia bacterium]
MRAMILAAGLGTRLRPLTSDRPKALVEINGRTLLELALTRLRLSGIREVIINVHHFPQMIADYLKVNHNFGLNVEISPETELLDTGGGLKKAAHFFLQNRIDEPFLLHNVDVISSIDFARMVETHARNRALATLAIQRRETSRYLLFDGRLQLCGRRSAGNRDEIVRPVADPQALAFCGIHVISPRIFPMMPAEGAFSIITKYLQLAEQGESISGFVADEYYWRDLGKPESVRRAAADLQAGLIPQ